MPWAGDQASTQAAGGTLAIQTTAEGLAGEAASTREELPDHEGQREEKCWLHPGA